MIDDIKLSAIMTTNVVQLRPDDTLTTVGKLFEMHSIHHLPVVEPDGRIIGIISKSDYYKVNHALTIFNPEKYRAYNEGIQRSLLASELMTRQLATLSPDDSVFKAAEYFRENLFRAIPIVDQAGKLVGIVTTYDLLNHAYHNPVSEERK